MSTAKGINQYISSLQNKFKIGLGKFAIETNKIMYDNKWKYVYQALSPTQYERTYEFLNANGYKLSPVKNDCTVEIYNDTKNMDSGHPSWVNPNNNQNELIPYYILYGNQSSLYSYDARDYWTPTISWANKNCKNYLVKSLREQGVNCR